MHRRQSHLPAGARLDLTSSRRPTLAGRPSGLGRCGSATRYRARVSTNSAAYPPLESLAFLSDGVVTALLTPDGSVEWLCLPRMDGPSVFGAILDREAGHFRVGPAGGGPATARRYLPGSLVLETTWTIEAGTLVVTDALAVDQHGRASGALVRSIACTAGEVTVEVDCTPAPDFGQRRQEWSSRTLYLDGDIPLTTDGATRAGRVELAAGDARFLLLGWRERDGNPDAVGSIARTVGHWRDWLHHGRIPDGLTRPLLERSALTLKGLIHAPTGAPMAAATTSLPETPGGSRNWDYRYTWIRDGVCTLAALQDLGFLEESHAFLGFIADRLDLAPLQVMYGVGGETELPESTLDHLEGYQGARPVRIGNGAVHQRQHDVWGWLAHLIERDLRLRNALVDDRTWAIVTQLAADASENWRSPDQGIWEIRGAPRHFGSSRLMAWVALDRAARVADRRGDAAAAAGWRAEAATIHDDLTRHGVDHRGVFIQSYGAPALDASMLLVALMDFLPGTDPRVRATVLAVAQELTEDGLVLRYRPGEADDGVSAAEEGSFTICSFWLVSALARIGETDRARVLLDRLVSYASPLGLYAEEIEPATGRHLGNMPQAFSHLALIGAVIDLDRAIGEPPTGR
jgi:alpha,alpha-trehalase